MQSINDIHKTKPAANVTYSRRMPDIDTLMQEWPPEMEAFLKTMKMPSGELVSCVLLCSGIRLPVTGVQISFSREEDLRSPRSCASSIKMT